MASDKISSSRGAAVVPVDSALPGLALLWDVAQVQEVLQAGLTNSSYRIVDCQVQYVRYKPGTNCLVSYPVILQHTTTGVQSEWRYYGKAYTADDYSQALQKVGQHELIAGPGSEPVVSVEAKRVIFYLYLNDRSLPGLRTLNDPRKLVRLLHNILPGCPRSEWRISDKKLRTTLIRYKPEKRAVSRIQSRMIHKSAHRRTDLSLYVRSYCDDRGAEIFGIMNRLQEALKGQADLRIPPAVAYQRETKLLFMDTLDGVPMGLSGAKSQVEAEVIRAAAVLARLHELSQVDVAERTVDDLMGDAQATGATLSQLLPDQQTTISLVLDNLRQIAGTTNTEGPTFVHGDFYYDQVLLSDQGDGILDFDRSYRGEALADVGNFCAHLHLLGLQDKLSKWDELIRSFVERYESVSKRKTDYGRLRFWTAFSLVQLSVAPFRSAHPNWPEQARAIVDRCREMLS